MIVRDILVTNEVLTPPSLPFSNEHGAVVDFYGVVRDRENGRFIEGILYEAFIEMARNELRKIADHAANAFDLGEVTLLHRVGLVPAGEASLFLRVSATHRDAAFSGSKWIIERLKQTVPIWKHPVYASAATR